MTEQIEGPDNDASAETAHAPTPITDAAALAKARLRRAAEIIEEGDRRLTALDGPCGDLPPDITLQEWREIYVCITEAIRGLDNAPSRDRDPGLTSYEVAALDHAINDGGKRNNWTDIANGVVTKLEAARLSVESQPVSHTAQHRPYGTSGGVVDVKGEPRLMHGVLNPEEVQAAAIKKGRRI